MNGQKQSVRLSAVAARAPAPATVIATTATMTTMILRKIPQANQKMIIVGQQTMTTIEPTGGVAKHLPIFYQK